MTRWKRVLPLVALMLLTAAAPGPVAVPADFDLRLRVLPAPDAAVQRLELPGAVLTSSRSRDLADLRLFDAEGRLLPIASVEATGLAQQDALPPLPILGAADALRVTGVLLQVGADGKATVSSVKGEPDSAAAVLLGILLDARPLNGTAVSLLLDAIVPASQPISFVVEASSDLAAWRRLGETTAFQARLSPIAVPVPLRATALRGEWLRVTWSAASSLLSPVTVRAATLMTRRLPAEVVVEATMTGGSEARALQFDLPFATPITSIGVMTEGNDILPYRLLGRTGPEQAWTLLGRAVTRQAGAAARIALPQAGLTSFRLEVEGEARTFTTAPHLWLGLAPRSLAFAAAGPAPYTLAIGRAGTSPAFLPSGSLGADQTLAIARIDVPADWRLTLALADGRAASQRRILLWAVLAAATTMLGSMAWFLWRSTTKN